MSVAFDSDVDITLEVAFDSQPFDASQSFTDISSFVRSFAISRGRSDELSAFRAGLLSFSVSNQDNRFNPSNTSSPFFDSANSRTKIQPLKQVRVKASYDGTNYTIFRGFLDVIPVKFIAEGADSIVQFTAIDAFRLFQNQTFQSVGWRVGRTGFTELGQTTRLGYGDAQELSSLRVSRILNSIGFPSSLRSIDTGTKQVITQPLTTNVLSGLRECELAENGQFFIDKDGKATFRNRAYKFTNTKATTVQATFDNSGSNLPYTDVQLGFDDNEVINNYSWTRSGGTTQFIADSDSIQRFTPINSAETTININDSDVASIIQQKLSETAIPIIRIDSLTINPRQNTNIWEQALGRDIGDRIKVNITNTDSSTFTDELFIESITHNVNASSQTWSWILTLSPASSASWVLGQAQLGIGTRFAYA
tara:strand:+ start:4159 stop:5424 length:1266 start_codon:yes stop_codon:yes gene_type:complete